jgi:hypothetical protein
MLPLDLLDLVLERSIQAKVERTTFLVVLKTSSFHTSAEGEGESQH